VLSTSYHIMVLYDIENLKKGRKRNPEKPAGIIVKL